MIAVAICVFLFLPETSHICSSADPIHTTSWPCVSHSSSSEPCRNSGSDCRSSVEGWSPASGGRGEGVEERLRPLGLRVLFCGGRNGLAHLGDAPPGGDDVTVAAAPDNGDCLRPRREVLVDPLEVRCVDLRSVAEVPVLSDRREGPERDVLAQHLDVLLGERRGQVAISEPAHGRLDRVAATVTEGCDDRRRCLGGGLLQHGLHEGERPDLHFPERNLSVEA
jgi:hypothetical protein